MAFILMEHEQKPIKLRGKKVVPSTVSTIHIDSLKKGKYIGIKTEQTIPLINHGGFISTAPELRDAYFMSNILPVTLGEEAVLFKNDEVFVPIESNYPVEIYHFECADLKYWQYVFNSFWVPCLFHHDKQKIGEGWFRYSTKEMIIVEDSLASYTDKVNITSIKSLFGSKIEGSAERLFLQKKRY